MPPGRGCLPASRASIASPVVDLPEGRLRTTLADPPPSGPQEGSTPNALALSPDGTRLFVAEADDNAVAAFDLSAGTSGVASGGGEDRLAGRFPAEWYPVALLPDRGRILVLNGKGRGSSPNPGGARLPERAPPLAYTLGQLNGTVTSIRAGPGCGGPFKSLGEGCAVEPLGSPARPSRGRFRSSSTSSTSSRRTGPTTRCSATFARATGIRRFSIFARPRVRTTARSPGVSASSTVFSVTRK